MRVVLRVVPLLLVLVSCPSAGHAFSWRHLVQESAPSCYTEKKITAYKPVWKDRTVEIEVTRVTWKKEDFEVKVTELVQKDRMEERTVIYHRTEVKTEDREISGCLLVPECVLDPATCCPRIITRPAMVKQKVKVKVLRDVAEPKKESVKVLYCEPVARSIQQTRMVPEYKKEKVSQKQKFCVLEPYETTVKVWTAPPLCVPCGPLPGYPFQPGFHPGPGQGPGHPFHPGHHPGHGYGLGYPFQPGQQPNAGPALAGEPNVTSPTSSPRLSFDDRLQTQLEPSAPNPPSGGPVPALPLVPGTTAPNATTPPAGTSEPPLSK